MDRNVCLFEMGHKPWNQKTNSEFIIPLQVSSNNSKYDLAKLKDNTGDNIADLNPIYGEVTGIYWIWKNYLDKGYKYIGQTTYRRPFMVDEDFNFDKMFDEYDIVLPEKMYFDTDVYSQYALMHNMKDFDIVIGLIRGKYPEYNPDIVGMLLQNYLYNSNGFIMKSEDYDKYCKFLFDILFEWQNYMGIHTPDEMRTYISNEFDRGKYTMFGRDEKEAAVKYQMRTLGFLSERIFNIYVNHNFKKPFIIPYKDFVK